MFLKNITFLLLFFVAFSNWAQNVSINGITDVPKKNKDIRIYEVSDFLTNTEKEIGRTKIDSFGRFSFTIQTPEIKKIILRFDDKFSWLYIEPNSNYYIDLPEIDANRSNFKKDNEIEMVFYRMDTTDINYKILGFEAWLDESISDIYQYKETKPGEFVKKISEFKQEVASVYSKDTSEYFINYLKYTIGTTVDNFQYIGSMSKDEKYNFYFSFSPFLVYHDKYMEYFQFFFEKYYYHAEKEIRQKIYNAVIRSDTKMYLDAINEDPYLKNNDLRDLIALLIIKEEIGSKELPKSNLIAILRKLEETLSNPDIVTIASNLLDKFEELTIGMKIPNYKLDEEIQLSNFGSKYIYFHFYNPSNQKCIAEVSAIRKLNEKYASIIEIVTIYPKPIEPLTATEKRNLDALTTKKFALDESHPIWNDLKINTFPYYVLVDEQLTIKNIPALAPSPNGLYETIEKTFYDIKRKKGE
jgi:thiol-disulfide isomerase/thioredoxin